jgi:hypothetical protein
MRLRSTAPPSFLVTVKPTRGGPSSPRLRICTTTLGAALEAPRAAARNSRLLLQALHHARAPIFMLIWRRPPALSPPRSAG